MRHRARALLALFERLLDLAYLRALQVPDLGREPLERRPGERNRREQLGMAVARHDLCRDGLAREPEPSHHGAFDGRVERRVGPDGA